MDGKDISLLHWAALNNRTEIARVLLDRGVVVDQQGGLTGGSPLHWAAHSDSLAVLALLVRRAARLDLQDREGCLPLHVAAGRGSTRSLVYLVARGQHVDSVDSEGRTPLMIALAKSDNLATVSILVRLGANIACIDRQHNNPLHWAVLSGKTKIVVGLINISQEDFCQQRIRWEDPNSEGHSALDILNRQKRCVLASLPGTVKHYIRRDILLRKSNNAIREETTQGEIISNLLDKSLEYSIQPHQIVMLNLSLQ